MSYVQNPKTATQQAPSVELNETSGAGPITVAPGASSYTYKPRRVSARSRFEKIGFWIVVVAASVILLMLLGVLLPKFISAMILGGSVAAFVGVLTLMNLPRPSGWGNTLLGRRVFPVLKAPDSDLWRLAGVNAVLVFLFTFFLQVVASFGVGYFFASLIVFGAIVAAAVFYNRVRTVVIKP